MFLDCVTLSLTLRGKLIFGQIPDVIWPMIPQQAVCGICSQSHGAERCRLNLEAFKFWRIIITDRVVVSCTTKIEADSGSDASVRVCGSD